MHRFQAITVTHKQFKINELGSLLPQEGAKDYDVNVDLHRLKEHFGWEEMLFLNTCNRILFFVYTSQDLQKDSANQIYQHFHRDLDAASISKFAQGSEVLKGQKAIQHLFDVASSIDSMVVGEREILHQLKSAYTHCAEAGLCGDNVRIAVDHAVGTAKAVYRETKIGVNPVSVVALSMKEILKHNPPKDSKFLLIGAGQTMQLAGKYLKKNGFQHYTIFNRTVSNAAQLSRSLNAPVKSLEELEGHDDSFDIIITCTGANKAILSNSVFDKIDNGQCKIIVDLAVPADIDKALSSREDITYISIDSLESLAAKNKNLRLKEVECAEEIIAVRCDNFDKAIRKRRVEKAMQSIPENVKAIKLKALNDVFASDIEALDGSALNTLNKVIDYLEKKYIGIPMGIAQKALDRELESEN